MKTNLLKVALGLFLLTLTVSNVKAQIYALENFNYPVGDLIDKTGGSGWTGPWVWNEAKPSAVLLNGQVVAGNLPGNNIGNSITVGGDKYAGGDNPGRNFTAQPNVNGKSYWLSFSYKQSTPGQHFAGLSLFDGTTENVYIGATGDNISIGNCWPEDGTFNNDDKGSIVGLASILKSHFYIAKMTFLGGKKVRVDLWADYTGITEPVAADTEPTFQCTGYYFDNAGAFSRVRLSSSSPVPPPALQLQQSFAQFDGVSISNLFANVVQPPSPLTGVKLKASSTATGNLVSWTSESQINVVSLAVERKDASGAWVNISGPLAVSTTSFKDTNPLVGDNYYQLVSTDVDGTTGEHGPAFAAGLEGDATTFYPNPVTGGELNVVAGKQAINSVSLFDLSGKRVSFKNNSGASSKVTVSTLSLKKGVYILEVNGQKSTSRNKVVIN